MLVFYPVFPQEEDNYDDTTSSFSRNEFQIYGGGGFGIYSMLHNDSKSDESITATGIYVLGAYYSLSPKFLIGINIDRLGFATNKDSAQSARATNVGLIAKYNVLRSDKNNIFFNLSLGTSQFKYYDKNSGSNVNAASIYLEPGIGFNHYWGDHFGYFLNAAYFYTRYNKIVNKDNHALTVINNGVERFWLALSGMHLKLGFIYKF